MLCVAVVGVEADIRRLLVQIADTLEVLVVVAPAVKLTLLLMEKLVLQIPVVVVVVDLTMLITVAAVDRESS
jgi:hypothetical protein